MRLDRAHGDDSVQMNVMILVLSLLCPMCLMGVSCPVTTIPDTMTQPPDRDGDGTPDSQDNCPDDGSKSAPGDCGCGVVDTPGCGQLTYQWEQVNSAASPSGRNKHAMAFDSGRSTTILFGGYNNISGNNWLADTWEWDGAHWIQRSPPASPPARDGHAMAYDSLRGVTVLFGGYGTDYLDDTWEWNGTNWTQRFPALSPPARDYHAMTYDSVRGVTVLFGGGASVFSNGMFSFVKFQDIWEWNGASWTQIFPTASPTPRRLHAMAYDRTRNLTVLFGGEVGVATPTNDTWEWNGVSWMQRNSGTSPPARTSHAMAFDITRGFTVVYGGYGGVNLGDTWEWDGTNWTQANSATAPSARTGHAMAYDAAQRVAVLFGGRSGNGSYIYLGDTWRYGDYP